MGNRHAPPNGTLGDPIDTRDPTLAAILDEWGLTTPRAIESARNRHWTVSRGAETLVLRRYRSDHFADLAFEREVMLRFEAAGWPVARIVENGRRGADDWLLMTRLPGTSRRHRTSEEQHERGRLLAQLHHTASDWPLRERDGFARLDRVVREPILDTALELATAHDRVGAEGLKRLLDATRTMFARLDYDAGRRTVVHGDFTPWNLLFEGDRLTGVIDFEACHRGLAVADFAMAWRGAYDGVIAGYESIRPLSSAERALIVPCYWAWLWMGIAHDLAVDGLGFLDSADPLGRFSWQLKQFARRDSVHFAIWRDVLG